MFHLYKRPDVVKRICLFLSLIIFLLYYCLAPPLFCQTRSLHEIEPLSLDGQDVLPALADLEDALAQRDHALAQSGLRIFGNIGFGNNTEPEYVGSTSTVNYNRTFGRIGVALPILGTWAKNTMAGLAADTRVHENKQRLQAARAANLAALRKAWIIRWVEYNKRLLIEQFLAEEVRTVFILKKRMEQRLLLPSDYNEFLTAFELARRDKAVSLGLERQAKTIISLATGQDIPVEQIGMPDLPHTTGEDHLRDFVRHDHPEILSLKDAAGAAERRKDRAGLSDIDARVEGFMGGTRDLPGTNGYNATIQIVLEAPLDIIEAGRASRRTADAAAKKAALNMKTRGNMLLAELNTALYARDTARANLAFARQRLAASEQGLQQNMLRYIELPGDTFEKYCQSRALHFRAGMDALSAVDQYMQAQAEVLRIAAGPSCMEGMKRQSVTDIPHGVEIIQGINMKSLSDMQVSTSAFAQNTSKTNPLPWKGVYIWDASPLLGTNSTSILREIIDAGFYRLLVSLTGEQINSLQKNPAPFQDLVLAAHRAKCTVELVLAEPSWIEQTHRGNLIRLLEQLKNSIQRVPLDGIHLDIEQDQLPQALARREKLAREFVATVRDAVISSPWPVRISIHPRYLDPSGPTPWMGKELEKNGVREAVLMAYIKDTKSLAALLKRILRANRSIPLAVAQSIEKSLPSHNSFFTQGRSALHARLELIQNNPLLNELSGGIVQSWEDYREASE